MTFWRRNSIVLAILYLTLWGFSLCAFPQEDMLSNLDKVSMLMAQHQYDIVMDIVEHVYQNNKEHPQEISEEDVGILYLGVKSCWGKLQMGEEINFDSQYKAKRYAKLIEPYMLKVASTSLELEDSIFQNMTDSGKIQYICQMHEVYEQCFPVLFYANPNINRQYARKHHDIAVKNCETLFKGDFLQKIMVCKILDWDVPRIAECADMGPELEYNINKLLALAKECSKYKSYEQYDISFWIYNALRDYSPLINNLIATSYQTHNTAYNEMMTNYFLVLNELNFFTKGYKEAYKYYDVDWKKIKDALYGNRIALQMFDGGMVRGCIEITEDSDIPVFTIMATGNAVISPIQFERYSKKYDDIYFSPSATMRNVDAFSYNWKIHLKFNLYDITRRGVFWLTSHNEKHYQYKDDEVLMVTDIDYGKGNLVPPLNRNKKVVKQLKQMYKNKMKVVDGRKVNKELFCVFDENIGVLHISTHGIIEGSNTTRELEQKSKNKNDIDSLLFFQFVGASEYQNYRLCLSGYNEDPQNNCITVSDVLKTNDEFYGLVYLDACNTAKNSNNFILSTSLAESFYIKGATSIIAYTNPINEVVAADFALLFYTNLKSEKTSTNGILYKNIHDVFYQTKFEIYKKYYHSELLRRDANNYPTLDIILWE